MPKTFHAESISDVQLAVRSSSIIRMVGNGTKEVGTPKSTESNVLEMNGIHGIVQYDPSEFTITAKAGTQLRDLSAALAERGQFLPFDPPLINQGATLGGLVASGISGPSRLRFGSVRDFVLGVQYVDGLGALARAGGKVVKNAAGFDIPKLMVGSWGELGALVEITLKVFPKPFEYCTVKIENSDIQGVISQLHQFIRSSLDIEALDIDESQSLLIRLGGLPEAMHAGEHRVSEISGSKCTKTFYDNEDANHWLPLLDWSWPHPREHLVRVPLTTASILVLDAELKNWRARCRYSVAGNLAWIAWPIEHSIDKLDKVLKAIGLVGRIVRGGPIDSSRLGPIASDLFASRIRRALDPEGRFERRV